jgi:L-serine deaminase
MEIKNNLFKANNYIANNYKAKKPKPKKTDYTKGEAITDGVSFGITAGLIGGLTYAWHKSVKDYKKNPDNTPTQHDVDGLGNFMKGIAAGTVIGAITGGILGLVGYYIDNLD